MAATLPMMCFLVLAVTSLPPASAAPPTRADDAQCLFQRELRAQRLQGLGPEPPPQSKARHEDEAVQSTLPKPFADWMDAFYEAFDPVTPDLDKSQGPKKKGGPSDMGAFMQYMQMLFQAVRSESFMGNITWMHTEIKNAAAVYEASGEKLVRTYVQESSQIHDKRELYNLTRRFFTDGFAYYETYNEQVLTVMVTTLSSMPSDVQAKLRPMMDSVTNSPLRSVEVRVPPDGEVKYLCKEAGKFFGNLTTAAVATRKALGLCGTTRRMLPSMSEYLTTMKPDVAPRVVYLVEQLINTSYAVSSDLMSLVDTVNSKIQPVMREKLECQFSSTAPRLAVSLGMFFTLIGLIGAGREL